MQYHDRSPVSCRFPPLLTALVPCAVFLTSAVTANNLLSPVSFPSNVTLCEPVNFTWAGGTPPYWLYIYGDLGNSKLLTQNTSGILTTWFVWIPDIPAVPRSLLRVRLGDSMTQTGFFSPMLVGSEKSSCLDATPPAAIPQASSTPGPAAPSDSQPSTAGNATTPSSGLAPTTSQSAPIPTSSTDQLNRAVRVVAGVAVAATACSRLHRRILYHDERGRCPERTGNPINLSRETDADPSVGHGEALRGVRRHHWPQGKRPCVVSVEPRLREPAELYHCQELGGVLPPAVGGPERASTRQVGREATEPDARSIRRAEAEALTSGTFGAFLRERRFRHTRLDQRPRYSDDD